MTLFLDELLEQEMKDYFLDTKIKYDFTGLHSEILSPKMGVILFIFFNIPGPSIISPLFYSLVFVGVGLSIDNISLYHTIKLILNITKLFITRLPLKSISL